MQKSQFGHPVVINAYAVPFVQRGIPTPSIVSTVVAQFPAFIKIDIKRP